MLGILRTRWVRIVACSCLLFNGCTAMLWEEGRFAQLHKPANPTNLRLFYSEQRQDVLVLFDEIKEDEPPARSRAYWLEPNEKRIRNRDKPHFVSPGCADRLAPITLVRSSTESMPGIKNGLFAVVSTNEERFTVPSSRKCPTTQQLPVYFDGAGRRTAQVLLTPVAVAVDITIVGAVIAVCVAPYFAVDYAREEQYRQGH